MIRGALDIIHAAFTVSSKHIMCYVYWDSLDLLYKVIDPNLRPEIGRQFRKQDKTVLLHNIIIIFQTFSLKLKLIIHDDTEPQFVPEGLAIGV